MARPKGTANFSGNLEVLASAPLDARTRVPAKADLTASGQFPYPYVGLECYVIAENKKYRLIADDPTDPDNWEEVGGGSGVSDFDDLTNRPEAIKTFTPSILPNVAGGKLCSYDPIGTIIAFMGTTAPDNYLACDGAIYNIADYQNLADFFTDQFGSANHFGGDGTTTFAVPDLRGEFLRGTGTNAHANQGSGANVGVHQNGTVTATANANSSMHGKIYIGEVNTGIGLIDADYENIGNVASINVSYDSTLSSMQKSFTSRPTNTSILYCIKYKADEKYQLIFDDKERVVGEWFGKKLYQKTIMDTMPTGITEGTRSTKKIDIASLNIDVLAKLYGTINRNGTIVLLNETLNVSGGVGYYTLAHLTDNNTNIFLGSSMNADSGMPVNITLQYTKTT